MTIQIDTWKALSFALACLVTYFVFKHTRRSHSGPPTPGDLVGAISSGAVVFAVLVVLLGPGEIAADELPAPTPTVSVLHNPTGGPSPTSTGPAS